MKPSTILITAGLILLAPLAAECFSWAYAGHALFPNGGDNTVVARLVIGMSSFFCIMIGIMIKGENL